jgi:hypothetical protein
MGLADSAPDTLDGHDPEITILEPAGSTQYMGGSTVPLSWSLAEAHLQDQIARIRMDGFLVDSLATPSGDNPYIWYWTVPQIVASFCYLEVTARDHFGNATTEISARFSVLPSFTSVPPPAAGLPTLSQPRPNPFNPLTHFHCELASEGNLSLAVFDLQGKRVRQLAAGVWESGTHAFAWDGTDEAGHRAASGTYLIRLAYTTGTARGTLVRKVVLLP